MFIFPVSLENREISQAVLSFQKFSKVLIFEVFILEVLIFEVLVFEVLVFEVLVFEVLIYFRGLSFQATISGKSIGTLYVFPNGLYW